MERQPTTWALIPIKAAGEGKTRLAHALTASQRERLVGAMLRHVAGEAAAAGTIARTCLVGPSRHGLDPAIRLLDDPGQGLNAALASALETIAQAPDRPDRLVVIAADLPCLTALDLDLLAKAPANSVAIAPDRHGTGTNALSLPLPAAARFVFRFGTDSCAGHGEEARKLGLRVETVLSKGLERDVDEPADLADARQVYSSVP